LSYVNCNLCPRKCGVDRTAGEVGFCGCPDIALVAKTMVHQWEEPALAGSGGSGAIFFGGCTLGCQYCQNAAISGNPVGTPMDSVALRAAMEELLAQGAENIDLVTPTQFLPTILPALKPKLPVPVVYNCGGYERVATLKQLEGLVDIYLPDMKYAPGLLGAALSDAPDYFRVAEKAIREMVRQTGPYQLDEDGILQKGVIIRHLILPGRLEQAKTVMDWVAETFPPHTVLFSLMSQYTPWGRAAEYPELNRRLRKSEIRAAAAYMANLGLDGFSQEESAARAEYIPNFDLTGL